jgi:pimeloyl-ACP methyl ester carboxylesterase
VGVVGVSMGGYLAYRAAHTLPGARAVVALLGSPEWGPPGAPGPDSPHRRRAALGAVALLSITAERDASVPPDAARRLHAALDAERGPSRYLELPAAEHLVSAAEWRLAMEATRDWLRAHLAG